MREDKYEGADFNYDNSIFKFQHKITKSVIWFHIYRFPFLLETMQYHQLGGANFKCDSIKIATQKHLNKAFFVPNLEIFNFARNFMFWKNWGCLKCDNSVVSNISLKSLSALNSLLKKRPYSELLRSAFCRIRTKYGVVSLRIQSEYGKIRTRITTNTNTFYSVFGPKCKDSYFILLSLHELLKVFVKQKVVI